MERGFAHESKITDEFLAAIDEAEEKSVTTISQQQEASKKHQIDSEKPVTSNKQA